MKCTIVQVMETIDKVRRVYTWGGFDWRGDGEQTIRRSISIGFVTEIEVEVPTLRCKVLLTPRPQRDFFTVELGEGLLCAGLGDVESVIRNVCPINAFLFPTRTRVVTTKRFQSRPHLGDREIWEGQRGGPIRPPLLHGQFTTSRSVYGTTDFRRPLPPSSAVMEAAETLIRISTSEHFAQVPTQRPALFSKGTNYPSHIDPSRRLPPDFIMAPPTGSSKSMADGTSGHAQPSISTSILSSPIVTIKRVRYGNPRELLHIR